MILVTGGTGLVGSHILIQLIENGQKVRAIKRINSNVNLVEKLFKYYNKEHLFSQVEWVNADILDLPSLEEAMHQVSNIYHSAAIVSFNKKHYDNMFKVNITGTSNVVNQALACGIKKIGHVSSIAALGRSETPFYTEENKWKRNHKNSYYAVTKYGAEREIWRASQEGISTVIINPGIIIGPSNWNRSSTTLFKQIHKGIGHYPSGVNGFVDVRDVSKGIIELINSHLHSERYILVSENLSYKDVFHQIALAMNKDIPSKEAKKWMLEIAWRVAKIKSIISGRSPSITKDTALTSSQKFYYDSTKIKKALNFNFIKIEDAIKNAADFF